MVKELSLFPLNLVCYPGEKLNLHIFEPRYKQLVNECLDNTETFGIPAFVKNKLELGTEVEIIDVEKRYPDGRLDIKTLGLAVFEVIDFRNPASDRTYCSGSVRIKTINLSIDKGRIAKVHDLLNRFYLKIGVDNPFQKTEELNSYSFAHKIGLSIEQEYQLLGMVNEISRLDFIIEYLARDTPLLQEIERTKERIAMNGHFKKFDTLDF